MTFVLTNVPTRPILSAVGKGGRMKRRGRPCSEAGGHGAYLGLRIPAVLLRATQKAATEQGVAHSEWVREALRHFLLRKPNHYHEVLTKLLDLALSEIERAQGGSSPCGD